MRGLPLLALALLLASCVSGPRQEQPPVDPAAQRRQLQRLDHFEFEGRLAAAVGGEGFNADLNWQQQGARSTVGLRAPLGFGSATIVSEGDGFSFTSSRGDHLEGAAALAELERRIGFAAPLAALRFWLLGVPDPSQPAAETLNELGQLALLEQDDWRIEYLEYRGQMPRRLMLTREQIRLRLVLNWSKPRR